MLSKLQTCGRTTPFRNRGTCLICWIWVPAWFDGDMSACPFGLFAMSVLCLRYPSAWLLHMMTLFIVHLRHFHCAADFCAPHRHIHNLENKEGTGSNPNHTEPFFNKKGGERRGKVENIATKPAVGEVMLSQNCRTSGDHWSPDHNSNGTNY